MRVVIGLIGLIAFQAYAVSQPAFDRTKIAAVWSLQGQKDYLASNEEARKLAILNITLTQLCECVSVQTTSKMGDDDVRQMFGGVITSPAASAYSSSRTFCIAALAR
jgi:hypothetical protein